MCWVVRRLRAHLVCRLTSSHGKHMTPLQALPIILLSASLLGGASSLDAQAARAPEVLLRLDDVGMNHSVNTAIARVAKTGLPFSVSVMFACPWYQEAAEILKKYPHV